MTPRAGRPTIGNEVLVRLGDLLPLVDSYANDEGIKRAEAIRQLIDKGLDPSRVRAGEWLAPQQIAHEVRHHGSAIPHALALRIIAAGEEDVLTLRPVAAQSLRWNGADDLRLELIQRSVGLPVLGKDQEEWVEIYEVAYKGYGDDSSNGAAMQWGWRRLFTDRDAAERLFAETAEENLSRHPFRPGSQTTGAVTP